MQQSDKGDTRLIGFNFADTALQAYNSDVSVPSIRSGNLGYVDVRG